jgi:hypothetical protein
MIEVKCDERIGGAQREEHAVEVAVTCEIRSLHEVKS